MTLRRTPADFTVEERPRPALLASLSPEPTPDARLAVYRLTKTSLTTPEAAGFLARSLGLRPSTASYGGLKDKHAVTTQLIALPAPQSAPDTISEARWHATRIGWINRELRADDIQANAFTIIARDLAKETCTAMDQRAAHLLRGESLLFVNYFGDQRFGSARHGRGFAARALIDGDFESALRLAIATPARKDSGKTRAFTRLCAQAWGDWPRLAAELPRIPERRPFEVLAKGGDFRAAFRGLPHFTQSIIIEAFQSYLWNSAARALARSLAGDGALRSDDAFGPMLFIPARGIDPATESLDFPLPSPTLSLAPPWDRPMADALAAEGITLAALRIPGLSRPDFGAASRRFILSASAFSMHPPERDELSGRLKRTLRFELPRGAYATVVLRALGH